MFGVRRLEPGQSSQSRPGDNKVLLCSAPGEDSAETLVRALTLHQIDCATQHRPANTAKTAEGLHKAMSVDISVRGSDLERARRIVRQSLDAYILGI
jgi:hypothetical protein